MELKDLGREELIQVIQNLLDCVKADSTEDAYYHCLDILYSLHRQALTRLNQFEVLAEQMRRIGGGG